MLAHRVLGALALLLGAVAHEVELLGDRLRAVRARFGDHAADVARAGGGSLQRLVEQAREALEPLLEFLALDIERGDQRVEMGAAFVDRGVGLAVAAVDQFDRLHQHAAVGVELRRELAEVFDHLGGHALEALRSGPTRGWWHAPVRGGDVVHDGREFGHAAGRARFRAAPYSPASRTSLPAAGYWPRADARTARRCRCAACCGSRSSPRPRPRSWPASGRSLRARTIAANSSVVD